jgi:hypothetical protein
MNFVIEQAVQTQGKARIAIVGPAGCGKTYTALVTAHQLGSTILVIDTENKTSAKYASLLGPFDVMALPNYSIKTYIEALNFSAQQGYDVVIVDSLSHAWAGKGGALEQAEQAKAKYHGNKFAGWADVTPLQNELVDTILAYPQHLIATMRMKTDYILVEEGGKQVPKKVGLGVIQRDSFEYEFDIIAQMDIEHNLFITKTRCFGLDGFTAIKPDGTFGKMASDWLNTGEQPKSIKPEQPKQRAQLAPKELLDTFDKKLKKDPFLDKETGEILPCTMLITGENTPKLVAAQWTKALGGDKDKYHLSLQDAFACDSAKDLSAAQANVILSWLLNGQTFGFGAIIVEPAGAEAVALYEYFAEVSNVQA